jgi:hypothetical protein
MVPWFGADAEDPRIVRPPASGEGSRDGALNHAGPCRGGPMSVFVGSAGLPSFGPVLGLVVGRGAIIVEVVKAETLSTTGETLSWGILE